MFLNTPSIENNCNVKQLPVSLDLVVEVDNPNGTNKDQHLMINLELTKYFKFWQMKAVFRV